jgi:hypothetical protein
MAAQKPASYLLPPLAAAALFMALTASKCRNNVEFVDFVPEICDDKVDNDEDGETDCDDSSCEVECAVDVVAFPPGPVTADSVKISGTHENAASITVQVVPSGLGGAATIAGGEWEFTIRNLNADGIHTVTVQAVSAEDRRDTAVVTFERRN